jgi:hypothetical protein
MPCLSVYLMIVKLGTVCLFSREEELLWIDEYDAQAPHAGQERHAHQTDRPPPPPHVLPQFR